MTMRGEILEYPYNGTIARVIQGEGNQPDTEVVIYEGVMDNHMVTDEEGRTMQTASYIICIPLTKDNNGDWIIPQKGDKVSLVRYGNELFFEVDNAEPSQLGGVSIYAVRKHW